MSFENITVSKPVPAAAGGETGTFKYLTCGDCERGTFFVARV
jgi:hypothetical protein